MASDKYDRKQMIEAIHSAKGKITLAARAIGCPRETVYQYAKRYATVQNAIDTARRDFDEELLDIAEHKLQQAVNRGERWAIKYALDKRGQQRGYLNRVDHEHTSDGEKLTFEIRYADDDD